MSKSVTVQLEDGTTHVYDNVPDEVSDAEVQQRASSEFGKPAAITAAAPTAAPQAAPGEAAPTFAGYSTLPTSAGQFIGAAQVPFQMAADHPAETAAALGLYKASQVANAYVGGKQAEAEALKLAAERQAQTQLGHQAIQQQKINLKAGVPVAAPAIPSQILGANGLPMAVPQVAAPIAPAQMAQQIAQPAEASLLDKVRQTAASKITGLAQASPMLATAGKVAGKILPGAGAALGGMEAYNRAQAGDYLGAGLAGVGGLASFVPGVGIPIGLGTTAINAARDYSKYAEAKKKFEEEQKRKAK